MSKRLFGFFLPIALASQAVAADLPIKISTFPAGGRPAFTWTGCYLGGNAGGITGLDELILYPSGSLLTSVASVDRAVNTHSHKADGSGPTAGLQAGCNLQTGNWVIGGEGDFNWSGFRENSVTSYDFIPFATVPFARWDAHNETVWKNLDWFSTVRARFGYSWDRVLVYTTGGLAIARITGRFSYLDTVLGFEFAGSESRIRLGPTVGGGLEWAFARRWSLKAEYLYMDFGSFGFDASPNVAGSTLRWGMNVKAREQVVRAGVNFRFD
jgi:outer membrane immunogenic protein